MRTIVINNQKGGVGKTTVAVHLAWFLAEEPEARVLFIDLDAQANASSVLSDARQVGLASRLFLDPDYRVQGGAGINVLAADEQLNIIDPQMNVAVPRMAKAFAHLENEFDYCVIDTPPAWGARNYAALLVTDYVISPIDLESFALQGVATLRKQIRLVEEQGRKGRKVGFLGLLPSRFVSTSPRQRENLKALIAQAGTSLMFEGVLTQRQGYAEAVAVKTPVWQIKKTSAQEAGREARHVLSTIKSRISAPIAA
jgi:chromosome partitioning protein